MKTFLVKQKFRLGGERFAIKDDRGEIAYQVEGSFFKIPKPDEKFDLKRTRVKISIYKPKAHQTSQSRSR